MGTYCLGIGFYLVEPHILTQAPNLIHSSPCSGVVLSYRNIEPSHTTFAEYPAPELM